ncbi:HAMP domain-containing protein [bacterium]|nr:MAG: HAMP domain-containing protein [bacterium]
MAKSRVSVKVAVKVVVLLAVAMVLGTFFLTQQMTKQLEEQLLLRGKMESIAGAKAYGRMLEEAIDNGVFSVKDAFDTNYEIISDFDPPKYHTKYDSYLDKAILSVQDEFLKDESVVFAVGVDVNGYLPTHNSRYQQPITGDKALDLKGNRTKRLFNDPVGINAAKNTQEGYRQVYDRDTGEKMWDIATPIYVKGKHWGGFRIGFSLEKTQAAINSLRMILIGIMALILVISGVAIIFTVNASLRPLSTFTRIAGNLADGNVDEKIEATSDDEIGDLADVLERLRVSLKAAMDRLRR